MTKISLSGRAGLYPVEQTQSFHYNKSPLCSKDFDEDDDDDNRDDDGDDDDDGSEYVDVRSW